MKIELYMACPVCLEQGYNSAREYWLHSWPCSGQLYIDEHAEINCGKCRRSEHITKMKLRCGNDKHDFAVASVTGFAHAISTSSLLVDKAGLSWLQNALEYLQK